jgi:hypothetical protein
VKTSKTLHGPDVCCCVMVSPCCGFSGDPRELVVGYAMLAERARADVRTLLGHGWGL